MALDNEDNELTIFQIGHSEEINDPFLRPSLIVHLRSSGALLSAATATAALLSALKVGAAAGPP